MYGKDKSWRVCAHRMCMRANVNTVVATGATGVGCLDADAFQAIGDLRVRGLRAMFDHLVGAGLGSREPRSHVIIRGVPERFN